MFGRAVIIGAGTSGWCAAAALAPFVDELVVVERDGADELDSPRRGVPQGRQLHNLLGRAQLHLEELIPGFLAALDAQGCGRGRVSADTWVNELGIAMPRRDLGFDLRCATRPVVDSVAARLVQQSTAVTVVERTRVHEVLVDHGRVAGLAMEGALGHVDADIVVDASGPAALAARTYERLGRPPEEESRQTDHWYVSVEIENARTNGDFWMHFPASGRTSGALISPTGRGTSYLSVSGKSADPVPETWDAVLRHVAALGTPELSDVVGAARPLAELDRFRKIVATWRRFDLIADPIVGLLPIGDAIASVNPLFGQGISVAAWEAAEMKSAAAATTDDIAALTNAYLASTRHPVEAAWTLGSVVDAALEIDGVDVTERLARAVAHDPDLHRRYVRMWHLLEPAAEVLSDELRMRLKSAGRTSRL